jgi:hypothetical protein
MLTQAAHSSARREPKNEKGGGPVGTLVYGNSNLEIEFDDRVLAHLQAVIVAKLRRDEGFLFSWKDEPGVGDGRSCIWMHRSIPLYFKYPVSQPPAVNRLWLEALTVSANSPGGLRIVEEPEG